MSATTVPPPHTADADETRDADEIAEHNSRQPSIIPMPSAWPQDAGGNYLAIVTGAASDKIPTVQFGNVVIGPVMIQRPVAAGSIQAIIDAARETQKAAEFIVGVERRLLQWAIDPGSKVASPVTGEEAFSAPPTTYDPSIAPVDPRAASEAAAAAAAAAPPAGVSGSSVPPAPPMSPAPAPASSGGGPQVG